MKHAYPIGTTGLSVVGNLSGFPLRDEPQPAEAPEPSYWVKPTESIEELFKLDEARETGDFTDAFLDDDY